MWGVEAPAGRPAFGASTAAQSTFLPKLEFDKWKDATLSSISRLGQSIAQRVDAVSETLYGCDMDLSDTIDDSGLELPKHEADALDALRAERPYLWEALMSGAQAVWTCTPVQRRDVMVSQANRVITASLLPPRHGGK